MDNKREKGRPPKKKLIERHPSAEVFYPEGHTLGNEEVLLSVERYEAIRLSDHLGLSQKDAASNMGISQQSFSRLITSAHKTVSDALVNAKTLRISGGNIINRRSLSVLSRLKRRSNIDK
jgi:uncharacterized protein